MTEESELCYCIIIITSGPCQNSIRIGKCIVNETIDSTKCVVYPFDFRMILEESSDDGMGDLKVYEHGIIFGRMLVLFFCREKRDIDLIADVGLIEILIQVVIAWE